jgi:hypothetical protein
MQTHQKKSSTLKPFKNDWKYENEIVTIQGAEMCDASILGSELRFLGS